MKKKCEEVENGQYDTAGIPIKVRICYCGTTACKYLGVNDYPLPADFEKLKEYSELHPIDRPCKNCGVPKLYENKDCKSH